ncbi:hypothetical protein ABE529_27420 [Pseudomonas koreensis]
MRRVAAHGAGIDFVALTSVRDFAGTLERPGRNTALGFAQVVMLGELAVNQALGNVVPKD